LESPRHPGLVRARTRNLQRRDRRTVCRLDGEPLSSNRAVHVQARLFLDVSGLAFLRSLRVREKSNLARQSLIKPVDDLRRSQPRPDHVPPAPHPLPHLPPRNHVLVRPPRGHHRRRDHQARSSRQFVGRDADQYRPALAAVPAQFRVAYERGASRCSLSYHELEGSHQTRY
jgi:hypothetical protein